MSVERSMLRHIPTIPPVPVRLTKGDIGMSIAFSR